MYTLSLLANFIKRFWPWILAFALSAAFIWVFLSGWRLGTDPIVYRNGAIVFERLPAGSTIYIDGALRHNGVLGGADTHVKEGVHTVIVDAPGYYPWNEMVEVTKNTNTTLRPILVRENPATTVLPPADALPVRSIQTRIPTMDKPLALDGSCVSIYESFDRIIAAPGTDCTPPAYLCSGATCEATVIFAPKDRIRSVTNYFGRNDALVVAAGDSVYVVEINPHTPQFFAPLYKGTAPRVINLSVQQLTVIDQNETIIITL